MLKQSNCLPPSDLIWTGTSIREINSVTNLLARVLASIFWVSTHIYPLGEAVHCNHNIFTAVFRFTKRSHKVYCHFLHRKAHIIPAHFCLLQLSCCILGSTCLTGLIIHLDNFIQASLFEISLDLFQSLLVIKVTGHPHKMTLPNHLPPESCWEVDVNRFELVDGSHLFVQESIFPREFR